MINQTLIKGVGIVLLSLLGVTSYSYCQVKDSAIGYNKEAFAVEALGHARGLISLNYERLYHAARIKALSFSARVGVGYTPGSHEAHQKGIVYFPFVLGSLIGKGKHYAQLKVGCTPAIGQETIDTALSRTPQNVKNEVSYIVSVGYRFMEYRGISIEVIPMALVWTNNSNRRFFYSAGFSIGGGY